MGRGVAKVKKQLLPEKYRHKFLRQMDGRLSLVKALKALRRDIINDCGGHEELSKMRLILINRLVYGTAILETIEAEFSEQGTISKEQISKWVQMCNTVQGLLSKLGLDRAVKQVTNLQDYIDSKHNGNGHP